MKKIYILLFFIFSFQISYNQVFIKEKETILKNQNVYDILINNKADLIAVNFADNVNIYKYPAFELVSSHKAGTFDLCFSPDNKFLAFGNPKGSVVIYDLEKDTIHRQIDLKLDYATAFDFSPDSKSLAIASVNSGIKIFSIEKDSISQLFPQIKDIIFDIKFTKDNKSIIYCTNANITVQNLIDKTIYTHNNTHTGAVLLLAVSPDSIHFASAGKDRRICVYSLNDRSVKYLKKCHRNIIRDILFYDKNLLLSIAHDNNIFINDINYQKKITKFNKKERNLYYKKRFTMFGNDKYLSAITIDKDKKILVSSQGNGIYKSDFATNFINSPHNVRISKIDDNEIYSDTCKVFETKSNKAIVEFDISNYKNVKNAYVFVENLNSKYRIQEKKGYYVFLLQIIGNDINNYKLIVEDKNPNLKPVILNFGLKLAN